MTQVIWIFYLSGEIRSNRRQQIEAGAAQAQLPVRLLAPVTDHAISDACGTHIMGQEDKPFWKDHKGAASTQSASAP